MPLDEVEFEEVAGLLSSFVTKGLPLFGGPDLAGFSREFLPVATLLGLSGLLVLRRPRVDSDRRPAGFLSGPAPPPPRL